MGNDDLFSVHVFIMLLDDIFIWGYMWVRAAANMVNFLELWECQIPANSPSTCQTRERESTCTFFHMPQQRAAQGAIVEGVGLSHLPDFRDRQVVLS